MSAKIHWNLLILFGVFCQGIISTLSENNIDESSDLLVRQKRVINRMPGGDVKEPIRNVPYIVSVRLHRSQQNHCIAVILTQLIALTVAKCVEVQLQAYRVYSGSALLKRGGHRVAHNITDRRTFHTGHQFRPNDGFSLITVNPPFVYSINTHNIGFYEGRIPPGLHGSVTGWGCNAEGDPGTEHPAYLRTINVPIISNQQCAEFYRHTFPILEGDICTLDTTGQQYCGSEDAGAPLVITQYGVNKLLGIHLWNGGVVGGLNPDVFIDLQHPSYKTWIAETMRNLEAHINNPNQNQHLPHHPNIH